ncbi:UNVERIFIED_ORG: hypothetical protein ABIC97_003567 [Peribacillus simplex]
MAGLNLRFKPEPQACPASYAGARVKVPFRKRKPYYGKKEAYAFLKTFLIGIFMHPDLMRNG